MKITDRNALALKLSDGQITATLTEDGLRLKLKGNSKRWEYRFSINKKRFVMGLGTYPDVSVATARKLKRENAELVAQDINPIEKRKSNKVQSEIESRDVAWLADYFYNKYILIHRERPDQPKQIINADILPGLGHIKLSKITPVQITQFLQSIVERGSPVHANKTLTLLKQMFKYAMSTGYIMSDPAYAITHKIIGGQEHSRDIYLELPELKKLWLFLDGNEHSILERYCIAFKILILTGVRSGELLQARWTEIAGDYWTIPLEHIKTRNKNPKPHKVYLSTQVKGLFEHLRNESVFIFPHRTENKPVYPKTLSYIVRDTLKDRVLTKQWTPHDLRRSFATAQCDILKTDAVVGEKLLNHSLGGMLATYNKAEMLDERKMALKTWADYLSGYIYSDNVVEFKKRS